MKRARRLLRRARRGQAMVEYSMITHLLFVGAVAGGWPFTSYLIHALSNYYKSIYFVLTSPVP